MIITGGKYKGRKIITPDENITRPTLSKVRMAVFNILQSYDCSSFFDMYAGSGIIGLEALSRGFDSAIFVEKNPKVAQILKKNIQNITKTRIKSEMTKVLIGDSLKIAKTLPQVDVAFIDPPYGAGIYEKSLAVVNAKLIILEHTGEVDFSGFELIKQKRYGDKLITILQPSA